MQKKISLEINQTTSKSFSVLIKASRKKKDRKREADQITRNCCANYGLSRSRNNRELNPFTTTVFEKRKLELIHKLIGKVLIGVKNFE